MSEQKHAKTKAKRRNPEVESQIEAYSCAIAVNNAVKLHLECKKAARKMGFTPNISTKQLKNVAISEFAKQLNKLDEQTCDEIEAFATSEAGIKLMKLLHKVEHKMTLAALGM